MLPVRFTTRLKRSDYIRGYFCQFFVNRNYWLRILMGYLIIVGLIKLVFRSTPLAYLFIQCGAVILSVIGIVMILHVFRLNKLLRNKNNFETINWEINYESITCTADTFENKIAKADLKRIKETSNWFFLEKRTPPTIFLYKKGISIDRLKLLRMIFKHKFT